MAYYHTCSYCGANLDPGEKCDCSKNNKNIKEEKIYGNRSEYSRN